MEKAKITGIISLVIGSAIGVWVYTRITSFIGQLTPWKSPFTEYETITLWAVVIALFLIIFGLVNLTKKCNS